MTDIYDDFDFGYDPSTPEALVCQDVPQPPQVPSHYNIPTAQLPLVGKQAMPNCFVWATAYGLATCWAAQKNNNSPNAYTTASADYTYIQVENIAGLQNNQCVGGKIVPVLDFLMSGGTATLADAPPVRPKKKTETCADNWTAYGPGSKPIARDTLFQIPGYKCTPITGPQGLANMRAVISSGIPLAYGTWLYNDFREYKGDPTPYVGNGKWAYKKGTTERAGHVMVIIGYDDNMDGGAVFIQNSFGVEWGANGYVWMSSSTLQATAQGSAFYISG